ncbi:MAG: virulence protein SciE type [Acidobacteria bacterium]|nr:virulence protein SciE type [Acidobacteriota bacterium]
MKTAREFFQAGKLSEAVQALNVELRNDPTDVQRRTFLFELLCFAGEYERAEKHLAILAEGNKQADMGALLYRAALHAERARHETFEKRDFPAGAGQTAVSGTLNGQPFETLLDGDPRVGPRLEVYAAGSYLWIPFQHIESIEMQPPKRLRDMLWAPALVRTGPAFKMTDLGEVLLPVLCPFSSRHADDSVRLGRATVWEEVEDQAVPFGQKILLADDEEIPFLEVRKIEFAQAQSAEPEAAEGAA